MKILIVGDWNWPFYEKALFDGFIDRGFDTAKYNTRIETSGFFLDSIQTKFKIGKLISKKNNEFIRYLSQNTPDVIFFYRPEIFFEETIQHIKNRFNPILLGYHNDNPFIQWNKSVKYRYFFKNIKYWDICYAYRKSNINHYKTFGGKNIKLLLPYYVKGIHDKDFDNERDIDVIFIGHYENDGRLECCMYLKEHGINIKIFGPEWPVHASQDYGGINPIFNDEYVNKLGSAKIALVFLSKVNHDKYTRRNFEIPATGAFMLTERTSTLRQLFIEGQECDFFSSKEELLKKVQFYLSNDRLRKKIANAGMRKCLKAKHNNIGRVEQIMEDIKSLQRNG